MAEIIPLVDEFDRVIGAAEKEKFDKTTGQIYRTVALFLLDKQGRILIQQRALSKNSYAGQWDLSAAAGHVDFGEDYLTAILRETQEEIGLDLRGKIQFLSKKFGEYSHNKRRFTAIFLAVADFEISDLMISKDEVSEVRKVGFSELGGLIKSDDMKFTEYSLANLAENQEEIIKILSKI